MIRKIIELLTGRRGKTEPVVGGHVTSDGVLLNDIDGFDAPFAAAMRNEGYQLAESIALEKVENAPQAVESWMCLTYASQMLKKFEEAIEACERAMAISPDDETINYARGFISQDQADECLDREEFAEADRHFNSAVQYYSTAIAIDAGYSNAYYGLAAAHEGLGNHDLVITYATRYLELEPDSLKRDDALDMIRVAKSLATDP